MLCYEQLHSYFFTFHLITHSIGIENIEIKISKGFSSWCFMDFEGFCKQRVHTDGSSSSL